MTIPRFDRHRMRLALGLSVVRIALIWGFSAPIYAALAGTSLASGDVFRPGGEGIVELLESARTTFPPLVVALCMLCCVVLSIAFTATVVTWVLVDARRWLPWSELRDRCSDRMVPLAFISLSSVACIATLLGCWWVEFAAIGAWLAPQLGERTTDLVQLGVFMLVLVGAGMVLLIADVARAFTVVHAWFWPNGVAAAWVELRRSWPRLSLGASAHLLVAVGVQLAASYAIARYRLLAGPAWQLGLAAVLIEMASLSAIALRLHWMAALLGAVNALKPSARQ
jgi:hypothetical protein